MAEKFDVRLSEKYYSPDPSLRQNSWLGDYQTAYNEFRRDPDAFWDRVARELHWFSPYSKVKEWNYPYARWFLNGKTNITYNCLDRHVLNARRNKVALIWRGEDDTERIFTYRQLYREVMRVANGLRKLGVEKGDRVCIYMPMVPEQIISMLACARIGAVHSVVFGGFGAAALKQQDHRRRSQSCHHGRCHLPPGQIHSAQAYHRRSDHQRSECRTYRRPAEGTQPTGRDPP